MEQLEQRIRRSSRLYDNSTFRLLLSYASMVRDEDQVYFYMEENKIGLNEPEFWVAKLRMHNNRCQYPLFIKVLKQAHRNHELKKHPKYWLIPQIERKVERQLQKLLRRKTKGRRSARQYEVLNLGQVQKQSRKFGGIQVYVDPDCRSKYRLQDLTQFVTQRLSDQCQLQRNCYLREISLRPLSFLGKDRDKLQKKVSNELFGRRNSQQRQSQSKKLNERVSLVGRKSNKRENQIIQTPDFKKKCFSKQSRKKGKRTSINQLDSVEILKNFYRRSVPDEDSNKKINPQFDGASCISSVKKEKIRNQQGSQSVDVFSQPDLELRNTDIFSFADDRGTASQIRLVRHSLSKGKQKKQNQIHNANHSSKDFAFFQDTQTQHQPIQIKKKSTDDLEHVIKEIQMQKYDSQTFSEIDSNKENNILTSEESLNVNVSRIQDIRAQERKQRKKFQTIKKGSSYKRKKEDQEESQWSNGLDESSQQIYQDLLYHLSNRQSENLAQQDQGKKSVSQKRKIKRISRISQERSYSFSETRPRSKSDT